MYLDMKNRKSNFQKKYKRPKRTEKISSLGNSHVICLNLEIPLQESLVKDDHVGSELFAKIVYGTRQRKQLMSHERGSLLQNHRVMF